MDWNVPNHVNLWTQVIDKQGQNTARGNASRLTALILTGKWNMFWVNAL